MIICHDADFTPGTHALLRKAKQQSRTYSANKRTMPVQAHRNFIRIELTRCFWQGCAQPGTKGTSQTTRMYAFIDSGQCLQ